MNEKNPVFNARIMVVDDNPMNVELLQDMLEDAGYNHLIGISDPLEVEGQCREQLPDLILLDIRMPQLDGRTLLRRLKAEWGSDCPPVIVLTAQTDEDTRSDSLEAGARDFVTKPFNQKEALQRIHNSLSGHISYRQRVDEAKTLEQMVAERTRELEEQALREPVTGMPNRRAILESLREELAQGAAVSVAFIALEDVDDIARLHGYPVTEQLVRLVGRILSRRLRNTWLACWGNAEFVCFQHHRDHRPDLESQFEELVGELTRTFQVGDLRLKSGLRIGISSSDQDSTDAEQLIRFAALALPEKGAHPLRRFDASLEERLRYRGAIEHELRGAVSNNELHLIYQPKINLNTGLIVGAEALLRWKNPTLGAVSPGDFIPIAEGTGEILTLGQWVLEEAIRQAGIWYHQGLANGKLHIAINVAARQLAMPDLADTILQLMKQENVPPGCLEVEVTESGLMEDVDEATRQLSQLAEAGVTIAIDDFGTGYSSLAYLKELPVNILKVDRAFVDGMSQCQKDYSLVRTVIAMAHNFNCRIVAEGIEEPDQASLLRDLGCEMAQGFWFARPMPPDEFEVLYGNHPDWSSDDSRS